MSVCRWLSDQRSRPDALANFDSTTTLVRALAHALDGEPFPALGLAPEKIARILPYGNYLPRQTRQRLYQTGSANEAIPPEELGDVRFEAFREWVVDRYPERGYPAVLVGSANGAAVHLAALLGIPWLPQTFLLPVQREIDPDDGTESFWWGREAAIPLLDANSDLKLHHMHDPNQDRLPIERMAYFRVKALELGPAYESFLESVLAPDGDIILVESTATWPTTSVTDRHVFQFGGIGGLSPEEYQVGGSHVRSFLDRQGSNWDRWYPPEPDGESVEAEWGFEPALADDVERFAAETGHAVKRLQFGEADELSPFVADCYRERYASAGVDTDRLVVDSFAAIDPWRTLRCGAVPYWLPFVTDQDVETIHEYLDGADPFAEIYLSLFSHGVDSAGIGTPGQWRSVLHRATDRGAFLGTNPGEFPVDYGSYVGYSAAFPETVPDTRSITTMAYGEFSTFADRSDHPGVAWQSVREPMTQ